MENLQERHKNSLQSWLYSLQRIDTLIITICGAAVYVILETLKFSSDHAIKSLWMIKTSGVLCISAIILNFVSQFTGKSANHYDCCWCDEQIKNVEPFDEQVKNRIAKFDRLSEKYSKWTTLINLTSMIVMFAGLITLILFFLLTF